MSIGRIVRDRRWLALALAVVGVTALAAVASAQLLGVRADQLRGRAGIADARRALTDSDVTAAQEAFGRAAAAFTAADQRLSGPPARLLAAVPAVGANVVTSRALARGGARVARAGQELGATLSGLPGGIDALAPRDGRVPLEPLAALAGPLADAHAQVAEAHALVAATPSRWLVGPVAEAREAFIDEVGPAVEGLDAAVALARHLPAFLGADGPRRYLLGAQNPAEVRGTGGLIGAFAILTVDGGQIDIGEFDTIGALTRHAPADLPSPDEDYTARYARYSAGVHGSNINMTPDMPTAATALETLHEAVTGQALDGTILADPYLLEALLRVVGPTHVPGIGRVRAQTVVEYVTNEQYAALAEEDDRKEVLGHVAAEVLRSFLGGSADPQKAIAALGQSATDGRLLLHAADPAVQEAFARAGVDGAMDRTDGDFLAVVGNNAGGNKLDAYTHRRVIYDVHLQPDGSARGQAVVELASTAPTEGVHPQVIGPNIDSLVAGQNRTILSVYCAVDCQMDQVLRNGEPDVVTPERELGRPVFTRVIDLPAGVTERLAYRWTVPNAWQPADAGGVYQLTLHGQPTIPPTDVTVRVHPPDGMVVTAGRGLQPDGGGPATWTGRPGGSTDLEAAFAVPQLTRVTRSVRDTLTRPLLDRLAADPLALSR